MEIITPEYVTTGRGGKKNWCMKDSDAVSMKVMVKTVTSSGVLCTTYRVGFHFFCFGWSIFFKDNSGVGTGRNGVCLYLLKPKFIFQR